MSAEPTNEPSTDTPAPEAPKANPFKEGDKVTIDGTVLKPYGETTAIVKMANGTNQIFKVDQIAKKP